MLGILALLACARGLAAGAEVPALPPSRVRRAADAYDVRRTATGGAIVSLYGTAIAEYIVDRGNKPFLYRLLGPTAKSMTRSYPMDDVPGESTDHVHQRGLTFSHQNIGGFDTWAEAASYIERPAEPQRMPKLGAIRHRGYRAVFGGEKGVIHAKNDFVDAHNRPLAAEERRMTFSFTPDARIIDIDIDIVAAYGDVELGDIKDAGLYIRVPDSMAVERGLGGTIVNAEGQRDDDAWSKPSTWVDYNGPVEGEHLGIAMLNHPTSFRHPTAWHVRTYGLFCANPFGTKDMNPEAETGAVSLPSGERLTLRHRVIFHRGDERQGNIAAAYTDYAAEQPAPLGP